MQRRDFLRRTVTGNRSHLALIQSSRRRTLFLDAPALPQKHNAHDDVTLGNTGIRTSRLAMGTGTHGSGGALQSDTHRLPH